MRVTAERPFGYADLEAHVTRRGWSAEDLGAAAAGPDDGISHGACRKRVARWKERGLTVWEADRCATALGVYPTEIWGSLWWEQPAVDVDQVFRQLRSRRRKQSDRTREQRRIRARQVTEYRAVERARERGPHRCAVDGCCRRQNAAQNVQEAA